MTTPTQAITTLTALVCLLLPACSFGSGGPLLGFVERKAGPEEPNPLAGDLVVTTTGSSLGDPGSSLTVELRGCWNPELMTQQDVCDELDMQCGTGLLLDACGKDLFFQCGGCDGYTCQSDFTCPEPCPEDPDADICSREAAQCGFLSVDDACGQRRDVNCSVAFGCEGGEVCDTQNQCLCKPLSCNRIGCGRATNSCGEEIDCGPCSGCPTEGTCENPMWDMDDIGG